MKKFSLPVIFLVVASLLLAACASETEEPATGSVPPESSSFIAEARLLPVNTMDQSFGIPGQVAEVLVADGENVTTGQVLARLASSPDLDLALARAEQEALAAQIALDELQASAQVNLTQAELAVLAAQDQVDAAQEALDTENTAQNRANLDAAEALLQQAETAQAELEANDGIDPDLLAAAQARQVTAEAALASAQAAIQALDLKATIAGTVVDLAIQPGQRVSAGQPLITLADYSAWVVKTDNLTEYEVLDITVGDTVQVVFDSMPEKTFPGEITRVNARFEEKRGEITYTVTVALSQADPALRWGMTTIVQFAP